MSTSVSLNQHDIEAIYFINLPHRLDRCHSFLECSKYLNHSNIICFEAIEGKNSVTASWPGTPGSFGCRASHIAVLEQAKLNGYKKFIVFEDDVVIRKNFNKKTEEIINALNNDWDMIYLYAENHFIKPIDFKPGILQLKNTLGLVGVIYNARNLDIIITKLKTDFRWVDSVMADLHLQLKVFAPKKSIVSHLKGFSDNEGYVVDYQNATIMELLKRLYRKLKSKLS